MQRLVSASVKGKFVIIPDIKKGLHIILHCFKNSRPRPSIVENGSNTFVRVVVSVAWEQAAQCGEENLANGPHPLPRPLCQIFFATLWRLVPGYSERDGRNQARDLFLGQCSHAISYFLGLRLTTRRSAEYQRYIGSFVVAF